METKDGLDYVLGKSSSSPTLTRDLVRKMIMD
jgi:hypothetical protein